MDVERTMQFILDMQAKQAVSLEAFQASQAAAFAEFQAKQAASLEEHRGWLQRHDAQIAEITGLIARLAQAELRLVERIGDMRRVSEERNAALDKKLGFLLDIADKTIRRNGHTQ
ncbi:MAG: hypothetical protein ACRD2H_07280 [Terriglobales bacterium]